jgi:hypothetical protein
MPGGPRVVLIKKSGAGAALGAATPSFALYGDRIVIFRARAGIPAPSGYLSTRLTDTQHQALMTSIAPEALAKLADSYVATTDVDPPSYLLHLWVDGRAKSISVFGDLAHSLARGRFPPELLRALGAITAFSASGSHWLPSMVSVYLWPMDHSREAPLPWPRDVPPSGYPSHKMNDGLNGLGMASAHFASVHRLLASLKPGQAVRLADRNWGVSYRLPFPYEDAWHRRSGEQDIGMSPRPPARAPRTATVPIAEPRMVFEVKGGRGGADSPVFALYADRLVIFRAPYGSPVPSGYLSTRLSEPQYRALISGVAPEALLKLADSYDAITGTDPVDNVIHVWVDGRRKTVSVAGHLWHLSGGGDGRSRAPAEFLRAYDTITNFSAPGTPWLPPSIEVLLWPRERFSEEVLSWPQAWPSPKGPPLSRSGMHRIVLPTAEFDRLKGLLREGHPTGTVGIENRRWLMSYRLPFPHEVTWACFGEYRACGTK